MRIVVCSGDERALLRDVLRAGDFQIRDDIIDLESPSEVSGKNQGTDVLKQKVTYPKVIGMEASKEKAIELCKEAQEIVTNLSGNPVKLIKLSNFISNRHY